MLRGPALLLALLALLACGASANTCVGYGKEACLQHAEECVLCRAWDRLDLCFEAGLASKLPGVFKCNLPDAQPAPAAARLGESDCDTLADQASCEKAPHCVWCLSAAVPPFCASEDDAHKLPPGAFMCQFHDVM